MTKEEFREFLKKTRAEKEEEILLNNSNSFTDTECGKFLIDKGYIIPNFSKAIEKCDETLSIINNAYKNNEYYRTTKDGEYYIKKQQGYASDEDWKKYCSDTDSNMNHYDRRSFIGDESFKRHMIGSFIFFYIVIFVLLMLTFGFEGIFEIIGILIPATLISCPWLGISYIGHCILLKTFSGWDYDRQKKYENKLNESINNNKKKLVEELKKNDSFIRYLLLCSSYFSVYNDIFFPYYQCYESADGSIGVKSIPISIFNYSIEESDKYDLNWFINELNAEKKRMNDYYNYLNGVVTTCYNPHKIKEVYELEDAVKDKLQLEYMSFKKKSIADKARKEGMDMGVKRGYQSGYQSGYKTGYNDSETEYYLNVID